MGVNASVLLPFLYPFRERKLGKNRADILSNLMGWYNQKIVTEGIMVAKG